jgi:hypothetical protein
MARKIVALILLALLTFVTSAQGESVLARVQWLDGLRLAVTTCEGDVCRTAIADLHDHKLYTIEFGPYLPEAYLVWRDSYIVSRLSDGAVGLWDFTGQFRPYASGEQVNSRPIVSRDGRYVALRLTTPEGPRLRVLDLFDSKLHRTLPLQTELPDPTSLPGTIGRYPPMPEFGQWDDAGATLRYHEGGMLHVYEAITGREVASCPAEPSQRDCPDTGAP